MGNSNIKEKKYVILYGNPNVGKTLLQYQIQAGQTQITQIKKGDFELFPTIGVNYEELNLIRTKIGIFDISGDTNQYNLLNLVCKSVEISGIIFVMSTNELEDMESVQEALERVLGNNYLQPKQSLYIIYNKQSSINTSWIDKKTFDQKLNIPKLIKKYNINSFYSECFDISKLVNYELPEGLKSFENGFAI